MTILYKVFGIILIIFGVFLAFSLVASIPVVLSSPLNMLSGFMLLSIVLYTWFSNKFHRKVLQQQQKVSRSLLDWIRVNGIVSLIYSLFIIVGMAIFISKPEILARQIEVMGAVVPVNSLRVLMSVLLVYGIILFVHVLWTFTLIRKNIEYFKS